VVTPSYQAGLVLWEALLIVAVLAAVAAFREWRWPVRLALHLTWFMLLVDGNQTHFVERWLRH
jgi:hypothetical protein